MASKRSEYTGVILAAGRGTRINPLSSVIPKPLLPICNKPVMQYQIEAMRDAGIRDILVIIGHLGEQIRDHFQDGSNLGVRMRYAYDEDPQGIASSLALSEPHISRRAIVFLGDIFLALKELGSALELMDRPDTNSVLLVKHEPDEDAIRRNFAVILNGENQVVRVIEKPKELFNRWKGCGVYLFDETIFDAIRRTPRSALRNEYEITDAIQTLIDMGYGVRAADAVALDVNLTFPIDLLRCNLLWLRAQGLSHLCGDHVHLADGTQLEEAILGDGTQVRRPTAIRRSVVFPHTEVEAPDGVIEHSILLPGKVIPCLEGIR